MTASKRRPQAGDERWEVEWCSKLAFYPDSTDVDHDRCTMSVRHFATREEALAFAVKTWPTTKETFGIVQFYPQRFETYDDGDGPYLGHWETTDDPETISDDSGVPE